MCRLCINNNPRMDLHLTKREKADALKAFKTMIQFETVSDVGAENGSYNACAEWILHELSSLQVDAHILKESKENKPIVVATFLGTDPDLPGILFNSHVDVVPADVDQWVVPPFEGRVDTEHNRIYGRGTQDMKSVCVQYIVAMRKLRRSGFFPKRTLFFSFVPDEEIGGADGMGVLLQSEWFKERNFALAFDEGLATEEEKTYSAFYGERVPWWVYVEARGATGHASRFIEPTAVGQIVGIANRALAFRDEQQRILHGHGHSGGHAACSHAIAAKRGARLAQTDQGEEANTSTSSGGNSRAVALGDVTSLNISHLRAGTTAGGKIVYNVVPSSAELAMDIRVSPHMALADMEAQINLWCEECSVNKVQGTKEGEGSVSGGSSATNATGTGTGVTEDGTISWKFVIPPIRRHATTSTDPEVNPWWGLFKSFLETECTMQVAPSVFPAATDSRFLRALGMRAIGFSPMRSSPILLHEHNEYLDLPIFYEGCEVYVHLMMVLSSQGLFAGDNEFYGAAYDSGSSSGQAAEGP